MSDNAPVIEVKNLVVDYGRGKKKTRALHGISLSVMPGECVGFIGANGAGKSTTMKTLMGFIFPTSGSVQMFGRDCGTAESRQRIGYLPEVALYYQFMKARELLELYGGLQGLRKSDLKQRIPGLLEKVGLAGKGEILLKNFSKGMQQRLGIAQSIIADPEALIFDELSSGLDPVGRYDLRDVLLELKQRGKTIFFSSHELSEVESLCDRVIMIHKGRIVTESPVADLLKPLNAYEITFKIDPESTLPSTITNMPMKREGELHTVTVNDINLYTQTMQDLSKLKGATIVHTQSKSRSLEDHFIELVKNS